MCSMVLAGTYRNFHGFTLVLSHHLKTEFKHKYPCISLIYRNDTPVWVQLPVLAFGCLCFLQWLQDSSKCRIIAVRLWVRLRLGTQWLGKCLTLRMLIMSEDSHVSHWTWSLTSCGKVGWFPVSLLQPSPCECFWPVKCCPIDSWLWPHAVCLFGLHLDDGTDALLCCGAQRCDLSSVYPTLGLTQWINQCAYGM